ncbi:hypothetical protein MTO96_011838 [Rhipicephalus appendiculatus]
MKEPPLAAARVPPSLGWRGRNARRKPSPANGRRDGALHPPRWGRRPVVGKRAAAAAAVALGLNRAHSTAVVPAL